MVVSEHHISPIVPFVHTWMWQSVLMQEYFFLQMSLACSVKFDLYLCVMQILLSDLFQYHRYCTCSSRGGVWKHSCAKLLIRFHTQVVLDALNKFLRHAKAKAALAVYLIIV